jgi:predicted ArsR family transcriptional regulator
MPHGTNNEEQSTRREIINLLRVEGPLSVAALGDRLGITHVAVRRHVTALERDGLVTSTQERLPMGRPTRIYSLTDAADDLFPKKYGAFTLEALEFMGSLPNGEQVLEQFFAARGKSLYDKFGPEVTAGESLKDRVARLTDVQTANGYLADWEEGEGEVLVLKEFNCPVHQVSRKYPQACHHEMEFFKRVLGTDKVERHECIAQGGGCCKYVIAPPEGTLPPNPWKKKDL